MDASTNDTAASWATSDVPRGGADLTAAETLASLRERPYTTAGQIVVLEGDRLIGCVTIERLLAAPPGCTLGELAEPAPTVGPDSDLEVAARQAALNDGRGVAVVGEGDRFIGLVPRPGCSESSSTSTRKISRGSAASSRGRGSHSVRRRRR